MVRNNIFRKSYIIFFVMMIGIIFISGCTEEGSDIVVNEEITSSEVQNSSDFDCSILPGEWITVPADNYFVEEDFCVMQFEAKDVGGVATSQAAGTPWVNINFNNAINACNQLNIEHSGFGGTFRMITNRQWMTIARNAEEQAANWDSGIQGEGAMFRGNSNGASALDGTNPLSGINTRTFTLSNGEVIWDLAGNVWQWVDLMEDGTTFNGAACDSRNEFTNCVWQNRYSKNSTVSSSPDLRFEIGPLGNFDSVNGVGKIFSGGTSGHVLRRGGFWDDDDNAGAFASNLLNEPNFARTPGIGFRCAFEP